MSEITATDYQLQLAGAVRAEWNRSGLSRTEFQQVIRRSRPTATSRWEGKTGYQSIELERIAKHLGITPYNLNESAALGVRFAEANPSEVELPLPKPDPWAQPARAKRRTA